MLFYCASFCFWWHVCAVLFPEGVGYKSAGICHGKAV
jgi:hypothetical protein